MSANDHLARFGYDPDDPVPKDEDGERIIPDRLIKNLQSAPFIPLDAPQFRSDRRRARSEALPLSIAEVEVLRLLADGYVTKQIAVKRGKSIWTIKYQIRTAMGALGTRTVIQTVAVAIRRGLL